MSQHRSEITRVTAGPRFSQQGGTNIQKGRHRVGVQTAERRAFCSSVPAAVKQRRPGQPRSAREDVVSAALVQDERWRCTCFFPPHQKPLTPKKDRHEGDTLGGRRCKNTRWTDCRRLKRAAAPSGCRSLREQQVGLCHGGQPSWLPV